MRMSRTTVRAKGQVTLPDEVRRLAGLVEGDLLDASVTEDGWIVLKLQRVVDADQAWFWSKEWQAGERQVDLDRLDGAAERFADGDELLAALEGARKPKS